MDNLVEYIVALIFIISFLSELFGKKKNKPDDANKNNKSNNSNTTFGTSNKKVDDIFFDEAIFNTKKTYDIEKKTRARTNIETNKRNDELIKKKKSLIEEYEKLNKTSEKPTKNILSKKTSFYSEQEMKVFTENINMTKQNLFNKTSLKDFIIAYEILNKPLALRNRCRKIL